MPLPFPILYEVNTRVWLSELSEEFERRITLLDIPDSEIERWRALGFTHIWLMGVWQVGERARQVALRYWEEQWRNEGYSAAMDVCGSPFAIQEYAVDASLGQPLDLLMLKERLSRVGIKLILDLVPNHFGVDTSDLRRFPNRFVKSFVLRPGTFKTETIAGENFFAHGRDPYFPPWEDTVQVDHRVAEAQGSMALTAQTISMFGDGLRCDMAMLLLPDIFNETWKDFPPADGHRSVANFWKVAIPQIRLLQPHVDLIAEAYWNREQELQDVGFDYTYNKSFTDHLLRGENEQAIRHLLGRSPIYLASSVHFLENHDEPRAASILDWRRHKALVALLLFLPGMVLLHDGQLEGRKRFARIQLTRRPPEPADPEVSSFYTDLLHFIQKTRIRRGKWEFLHLQDGDQFLAIGWRGPDGDIDVAIVNLGKTPGEIKLLKLSPDEADVLRPLYSTEIGLVGGQGTFQLPPESAHILSSGPPE